MKISVEWLKEYVNVSENPSRLKADLSMQGLLVEDIAESGGNPVLDIEITSNRPDCLSHIGIAREIAAMYDRPLRLPPTEENLSIEKDALPFGIEIADPDICPRYVGLVMDGVKVGPSPEWMQKRLEAAGMRPLNNIVDITNYVLLEMGHPLHAFDFDVLRGGKIVVKRSSPCALFKTLDGVERKLDGEMLLINDGEGPIAVAGVMGGFDSEITQGTTRVLLEAAYFQPASIRRTSRRLGLSTEASYRFERGADWDNLVQSIARTCYLIKQLAGGRVAGSLKDVYPLRKEPARIELRRSRIAALLGVEPTDDFVEKTLRLLGFTLEKTGEGSWTVTCPTFRTDMELEADLIEELARFYGYDNIPMTYHPVSNTGILSPIYTLENTIRETCRGYGHSEAVNLSFAAEADHLDFPPLAGERAAVRNPLTEDTRYMRATLAAGLVYAAKRNFNFSRQNARLFEIGKTYFIGEDRVPVERNALGILGTGGFFDSNWLNTEPAYTFYHLKGLVEGLLQRLKISGYVIEPIRGIAWLAPEDAARIRIGDETIGVFGTLSPELEEKLKLRYPVLLAEIDIEKIAPFAFAPVRYKPLQKLPSAERDLSVLLDRDISFKAIHAGIEGLGITALADIRLIDVYEGEKIPKGKVSLTLKFVFLDREKTLTMEQIQEFMNTILTFLTGNFAAELR